jgi:ComF family protein
MTEYLCDACLAKALRISPPFCERCSEPFAGTMSGPFSCANCSHRRLYFEAAVAVYRSRGVVRQVVHQFKYGQQMHLRHPVGQWLCAALEDARLRGRSFDLIVPVPLHPAKQRERGFNQAALLAQSVGRRLAVVVNPVLRRVRYTRTQTAFDRTERMGNLRGAFRLRRNADVRGLCVLLVDDVLTTGATLSECARVLKKAGARSIFAATAARA